MAFPEFFLEENIRNGEFERESEHSVFKLHRHKIHQDVRVTDEQAHRQPPVRGWTGILRASR